MNVPVIIKSSLDCTRIAQSLVMLVGSLVSFEMSGWNRGKLRIHSNVR